MSNKIPPKRADAPAVKSQVRNLARKMLAGESSDTEILRALRGGQEMQKKKEDKPG